MAAGDATDRQRLEQELWQSHQHFQALLQQSWDILSILDAEGRLVYNSPACERIHGFTPEELLGKSTVDLIHPEDAPKVAETMGWILAHPGEPATVEYRYACKDGHWVWMEAVAVNYLDHPAIRGIVANSRDISERKQAEGTLRDALELNERMVESQPLGVLAYHAASGRCVRANEAVSRFVGASVPQLLTQNFRELRSWKDAGLFAAAERALATGSEQHLETLIHTTFGRDRWLSAFFSVFHTGHEPHLLMLCEDITARREAEVALRKASAAVEQSPAAIIITNTQGTIEYVNVAFTRITGYTVEEAVGQNPRFLKSGFHDLAFYQDLWRTIVAGQTWMGRIRNRRKDGSLYWEEASISPLRNDAGEITHFVASKLDITEVVEAAEAHRRLQEQVARTQKLESLGSLAGGVAHDMNNVLGAILGLASMHQLLQPEGSDLRRDMDTIVKACQRGGTMVKGLLGFARQGLAEAQDVDLNSLVRDEVALLSRTTLQRVQLVMELAEGLPLVRGDASALSHLLMNLCVNAVDAMGGGGSLSMRTINPGTGYVVLEISDTGCGMSKEVLDKALDPYFTTKPHGKGTGLGLPIVYGTVKAHRGRMDIDSAPGQGTRVSIFLPALEATVAPSGPAPTEGLRKRGLDVLVVDDDEMLRDIVMQLIRALGHRSTVAGSGEEALQALETGLCADLVILDLNMPGLGGAATLPRIRELRPDLPVLLATGRVDQEALDLVHRIAGVSLMPKPFTLAEVRKHLEPFCGD